MKFPAGSAQPRHLMVIACAVAGGVYLGTSTVNAIDPFYRSGRTTSHAAIPPPPEEDYSATPIGAPVYHDYASYPDYAAYSPPAPPMPERYAEPEPPEIAPVEEADYACIGCDEEISATPAAPEFPPVDESRDAPPAKEAPDGALLADAGPFT